MSDVEVIEAGSSGDPAPDGVQISGARLREVFTAAASWLERNAQAINAINVFPVPDGDTGSNMATTLRDTVGSLSSGLQSAGDVSAALAKNALMSARGNSGVILSQILRGFANATAGMERIDGPAMARAFGEGAKTAYSSLEKPVEGTILTVARAAADAAAAVRSTDPRAVLEEALAGARAGLARTPELLPQLRQAGVVDSGGFGLVVILEGAVRFLRGEPEPDEVLDAGTIDAGWLADAAAHGAESGSQYGYCTEFIILGQNVDVPAVRGRATELGDSVVVAGDAAAIHVHLHTDDPGAAITYATSLGSLTRVKIENMQLQHESLVESLHAGTAAAAEVEESGPAPETAIVFVVAGDGLAEAAKSTGATTIVHGGQTMNPSVEQILNAIERSGSRKVVVLPNNKNVILTARQAAQLCDIEVRVVPTRSTPQGLTALLAFSNDVELDENEQAMSAAAGTVRTIEVTTAARSTRFGDVDVRDGQPIGLLDDELVVASETFLDALIEAMAKVEVASGSLVTLYHGEGAGEREAQEAAGRIAERFPGVEVQVIAGGQPHYPFMASIE